MTRLRKYMLTALVLAIPALAQAELKATEKKNIRTAASRPVAFHGFGVVQEFTGNFESVAKNFDAFSKEFRDQKIKGKPGDPALLILLEDPTGKSEFRYVLGYVVDGRREPKAPLEIREMDHPQAVRVTHIGDYRELEEVHTVVRSSLKEVRGQKETKEVLGQKETKFPVVLRLLNDPRKVAPARRKTELIIPVG